jgi:hypothetical protein
MIYKRTAAAVVVATMLLAASVAPALADPVFTKTEKEVKKVNKQEKKIAEKKWTHKRADAPKLRCSGGNKNELSILFEAGKDGSEKGHEVSRVQIVRCTSPGSTHGWRCCWRLLWRCTG